MFIGLQSNTNPGNVEYCTGRYLESLANSTENVFDRDRYIVVVDFGRVGTLDAHFLLRRT